jgi:hypothetical protein
MEKTHLTQEQCDYIAQGQRYQSTIETLLAEIKHRDDIIKTIELSLNDDKETTSKKRKLSKDVRPPVAEEKKPWTMLLIAEEEGEGPSMYWITGSEETCKWLSAAVTIAHKERTSKAITSFNETVVVGCILGHGISDDAGFVTNENSNSEISNNEAAERYFGTVSPDFKSYTVESIDIWVGPIYRKCDMVLHCLHFN